MNLNEDLLLREINKLITSYKKAELCSLSLPIFSFRPLMVVVWGNFKFLFFIALDFFILLGNSFVLILKIFRKSCSFIPSRSKSYFQYLFYWIMRGEVTYPSCYVIIRPGVRFLLAIHFRQRLKLFRRLVSLEVQLSSEMRASAISSIDEAIKIWPQTSLIGGVITYLLPLVPIFSGIFSYFGEVNIMGSPFILSTLVYLIVFVISLFIVKRGLLLGNTPTQSYLPGAFEGNGAYGIEQSIFQSLNISRSEIPLDMVLIVVIPWISMYQLFIALGTDPVIRQVRLVFLGIFLSVNLFFLGITFFATFRRYKLLRA